MRNEYEIRGDHVAIFVWYEGERLEVLVDTDDLPRLLEQDFAWHAFRAATTGNVYIRSDSRHRGGGCVLLHRFIMNAPHGWKVDHRRHDTLDNRKAKLRIVSHSTNSLNRSASDRGVSQAAGKWEAHICVRGTVIYLGRFETKDQASAAFGGAFRVAEVLCCGEDEWRLAQALSPVVAQARRRA